MIHFKIAQIMTKDVVTVATSSSLFEVIRTMQQAKISCVVISEQNKPVGIFTERDTVAVLKNRIDLHATQISDIMSKNPLSVSEKTDFMEAYRQLSDHNLRHLIVTNAEKQLVGLVSESDFIKHMGEEFLVQFKEVSSLMNPRVDTLSPNSSVQETLETMSKLQVSSIVIAEHSKPVGIFTERDVVKHGEAIESLADNPISQLMTTPVITVSAQTSIHEALGFLSEQKIRRLVVVDEENNISGILTRHDIVKSLKNYQLEYLKKQINKQDEILASLKQELVHEKQLKRYQELLLESQRIAQIGSWEYNLTDQSLHWTDETYRILDMEPGSTTPSFEQLLAFVSPQDRAKVSDRHQQAVKTGKIENLEYLLVLKGDQHKYIKESGRAYYDDQGNLFKVIGTLHDITQIKQSELCLQQTTQELTRAQEIGNIGNWTYQVASQEILWSDQLFKIFGRPHQKLSYQLLLSWVHPNDQDRHNDFLNSLLSSKPDQSIAPFKYRLIRPNGEVRWVNVEVTIDFQAEQKASAFVGTIQDITEEEQQKLVMMQHSSIFENLSEGILITDENVKITNVNPAFTRITGYEKSEILGQNPSILSSGRQGPNFYKQLWNELCEKGKWQGEITNRRKDGTFYPEWLSISSIKNEKDEITHFISVFSDISRIKKKENELRFLAHHDPLTSLPNRILLHERLQHSLERSQREESATVILFLDIDRFKTINDSYGHSTGDLLLIEVAQRLKNEIRGQDTVARISSDEFIIILEDVQKLHDITYIAQKLITAVTQPFLIDTMKLVISASIGISKSPEDGTTPDELLKKADIAVYKAKGSGRNNFEFYSEEMSTESFELVYLSNDLNNALEKQEFELHYQPQVDAKNQKLVGVEALVRWNTASLGQVAPDHFIPLLEDSGMIIPIGEWILREACFTMKSWLDDGLDICYIAVNVSGKQLADKAFPSIIQKALDDSQLPAEYLELELTESLIMQEVDITETLHNLKDLGLKLSIDDFGTGYSSLKRLRNFPIDKIKIDRMFVKALPQDEDDVAITQAVIGLAKSLGLELIAEGVEETEQKDFLLSHDCPYIQGYLYSVPVPESEVRQLFDSNFFKSDSESSSNGQ